MSTGSKRVVKELEVWLLEECFRGANGVRGVSDNDVVSCSVFGKELETVTDVNGDFWRGKEGSHMGKVLLGYARYGL